MLIRHRSSIGAGPGRQASIPLPPISPAPTMARHTPTTTNSAPPGFGGRTWRVAALAFAGGAFFAVLIWSGVHFLLASRTLTDDLRFVREASAREAAGESIWG